MTEASVLLNSHAFAELRKHLRLTARIITRSDTDAEDVVQLALLRALERASPLPDALSWRSWLQRVVRNAALDVVRSRERKNLAVEIDLRSLQQPEADPEPCWSLLGKDDLAGALRNCRQEFRAVYELYYHEELSYDQIACRLNIPAATVATRLHRARVIVRNHFISQ